MIKNTVPTNPLFIMQILHMQLLTTNYKSIKVNKFDKYDYKYNINLSHLPVSHKNHIAELRYLLTSSVWNFQCMVFNK